LLSWWPRRADPNLLFLTYERMVAEPAAAVAAIARFLGGRAADLVADARGLERVVRLSSFGEMQRDQGRWSSQRAADMPAFVRKGVVGDYANYFTSEQARKLVAKMRARMTGAEIEALWPDLDTDALAPTSGDRHAEQ
jgi:hypothetical protein